MLLAAAALALGSAKRRRTPDDTIVFVLEQPVQELDPRYLNTNWETKISRLVAPGLVSIDQASMEPIMDLAESVTPVDPLTWDVKVRSGIQFPDGTELGARDVVYTFQTVLDPAMKSTAQKTFAERIASVEQTGDMTVRFHLKEPLATFVTDLEYGIVEAKAAEAAGGRFENGMTVGAGAYQIERLRTNEVDLVANPHRAPPTKRIVFRTIGDANSRLLVLVGGSADLSLNSARLDLLGDVAAKPRLAVETGPSALLTYLMMNNDDPILKDPRVRQAIALAIDRERIVRGKLGGHAVLATGLLAPSHWAYSGDVARYDHDPARAKQLLDEAGYPDPDGDGPAPRFRLTYKTSSDLARIAIARLIAQDLGEIGISVEVRSFEFATMFADVKAGNFQLSSMQTSEIAEPDMYFNYFHSSRIPTADHPDLGNRWRYRSARADALMEAGRHELDREKRKAIYAELQKILADDLPIVPLWHEDNVAIRNRDVTGFEVLPDARLSSLARTVKRR